MNFSSNQGIVLVTQILNINGFIRWYLLKIVAMYVIMKLTSPHFIIGIPAIPAWEPRPMFLNKVVENLISSQFPVC